MYAILSLIFTLTQQIDLYVWTKARFTLSAVWPLSFHDCDKNAKPHMPLKRSHSRTWAVATRGFGGKLHHGGKWRCTCFPRRCFLIQIYPSHSRGVLSAIDTKSLPFWHLAFVPFSEPLQLFLKHALYTTYADHCDRRQRFCKDDICFGSFQVCHAWDFVTISTPILFSFGAFYQSQLLVVAVLYFSLWSIFPASTTVPYTLTCYFTSSILLSLVNPPHVPLIAPFLYLSQTTASYRSHIFTRRTISSFSHVCAFFYVTPPPLLWSFNSCKHIMPTLKKKIMPRQCSANQTFIIWIIGPFTHISSILLPIATWWSKKTLCHHQALFWQQLLGTLQGFLIHQRQIEDIVQFQWLTLL